MNNNKNNNNNNVIIRLYLVRHGETIANLHNNVIGQTDSPLTELGKQQAMALGKWLAISNPFIIHSKQQEQGEGQQVEQTSSSLVTNSKNDYFWRIYSSDLGRTKHTTQLILQQYYTYIHTNNHHHYNHHTLPKTPTNAGDESENKSFIDYNNVLYDPRLREIARGVRQGLSKQYTYNAAMKIYNDGLHPMYNNINNNINNINNDVLPLNESDDDGWDRIYTLWLNDLVYDIQKDVIISQTQPPITNTNTTTTIQQQQEEEEPKYYNILVVTHGALLRVFLNRLLGTDRIQKECNQNGISHDDNNDNIKWLDETQQRTSTNTVSPDLPITTSSSSSFVRLHVPNTSLTMIDIPIADNITSVSTIIPNITYPNTDNITVQRFLSIEHYQLIEHEKIK